MTQVRAAELLTSILSSSCTEARAAYLRLAVDYAHIRAEWALSARDVRAARNDGRTKVHNALIEATDALARAMGKAGEDDSWRAEVGHDRRDIGDFACQVHCLLGIMSR
ncbi:MAG: hypothetical protein HZB25_03780 [Candidatus Eisenbacteria bacterium]|nr:hypothetical protein [Candidatus Eisenbacteria bacterium]